MRIAVLGTGTVGQTIGTKLVDLGHDVWMGSRSADNDKGTAWADAHGSQAHLATFADAAARGEMVFNCTGGMVSLQALTAAGAENLSGKILLDLANPLDFSNGMPPSVRTFEGRSLAETLQAAFPEARIVKTLNTVNCDLMVDPGRVSEPTDLFIASDDAAAKAQVVTWLAEWFGWGAPIDLGDLVGARGMEAWLALWVRMWGALGTADFNVKVVR